MYLFGIGLHVLVALYFAVHAVRTGQGLYWLFVLFMFPLLGSVVYALAIWLPEVRHSRPARQLGRNVRQLLDPGRELREARQAVELTATAQNRLRLADALVQAGRPGEAVPHYQAALRGIHADDPHVQVRLATALLAAGDAAGARALLEALIAAQPEFKSPEGHLVYARSLAALGERDKASEEFEVLVGYYSGLEARARYAGLLVDWDRRDRAGGLIEESLKLAARMPKHPRELNKEWIAELRRSQSRLA
jgi:hypothetical protein